LVTADFLSALDSDLNSDFSSSVEAGNGASSGSVSDAAAQDFNGDSGTVLVTASLFYVDDSTESDLPEVKLLISVTTVDGELLVSNVGECDTDSESSTIGNVPLVSC
jgi:hypothetical protein